jgi:hypothetical protein
MGCRMGDLVIEARGRDRATSGNPLGGVRGRDVVSMEEGRLLGREILRSALESGLAAMVWIATSRLKEGGSTQFGRTARALASGGRNKRNG